jgi:hypothetical protein
MLIAAGFLSNAGIPMTGATYESLTLAGMLYQLFALRFVSVFVREV